MGQKILVIDDDRMIRDFINDILTQKGFIIIQAENGQDGLLLYNETKPALVITDIHMPKMGGIELIAHLRTCSEDKLPILAISSDDEFLNHAKAKGANTALRKPFRWHELVGTVDFLLLS